VATNTTTTTTTATWFDNWAGDSWDNIQSMYDVNVIDPDMLIKSDVRNFILVHLDLSHSSIS